MNFLFVLVSCCLLILISSCKSYYSNNKIALFDTVQVVCQDYGYFIGNNNITDKTYLYLKVIYPDRVIYELHDTSLIRLKSYKTIKSSLILFNTFDSIIYRINEPYEMDTCWLFEKKTYNIEGKAYEFKKYYSEGSGAIDDEYEIIINDSIGIVRLYSAAWFRYCNYYINSRSQKFIECLDNDTSLFLPSYKQRYIYLKKKLRFLNDKFKLNIPKDRL